MNSSTFTNEGSRIAYQANNINIHGDSIVQHAQDPLAQLPHAADAPFNSLAKQHEPTCLADTRVDLLNEIQGWAEGQDERCIFWLRGLAGTGKSTIARTVARRYHDRRHLAASFFFCRGGGDVGHAGKFVTSIAVQLAHSVPASREHICAAVAKRGDVASLSLRDQWQHLVLRPLSKLRKPGLYIVVIDALDECDNDDDAWIILRLLAEARSLQRVRLRVFLTSRPVVPIRHGFGQMTDAEHRDFVLHDISPPVVDKDIRLYLETELQAVGQKWGSQAGWPGSEAVVQLVQSASGLFIWAATACRFICGGKQFAARRLQTILRNDGNTTAAPEKHLDQIYITVLQNSVSADYTDEEREEQCGLLRYMLGSVVVLLSTLSMRSLNKLLHSEDDDIVRQTLADMHAILDIPDDPAQPLRLHHPSFRDFLLSRKRCGDENFWVDERSTHKKLASCCLDRMSARDGLRQNICNLSGPGVLRSEIDESRISVSLPPELQYACRYWVDHLERSQRRIEDGDATHHFLQKHLLHWLETMSLMNETSLCVRLVARLQSLVMSSNSFLARFLHDAHRFVLRFVLILAEAPLQVYSSALLFSPEESIVRKAFVKQVPQRVNMLSGRDAGWDACRSVLEGHSNWVSAVVFSPDGQLVASASWDKTVRVWETATGQCRRVLKGHLGHVSAMVFSPDGQLVASASWDRTVRVWETATGQCRDVLKGHSNSISAVVFSPDGQLVASASTDRTVRVWETATGQCHGVREGHSGLVSAVVFSPDGQLIASASHDSTVRVWETATGQCRRVLEGHSGHVSAVVFSPDGQLVASASHDSTVRVWETATGQCRRVLEGHLSSVSAVVFSPDGQLVASSSTDRTVRVWETTTGQYLGVLEGHSREVRAVVFSPDGQLVASASLDRTVRVWETATVQCRDVLKGHSDSVSAVVFSPDGQLVASASGDKTVRMWETATGQYLGVLEGHSRKVSAVVFSPDGQLVASTSDDSTVRVWETATGQCRCVLKGHLGHVSAMVFSPDGQLVASASWDRTVPVWETATGQCRRVLKGHSNSISAVVFSPDGQLVASASTDRTVRVWETATGQCRRVLKGHSNSVKAVVFSPDGQLVASASDDRTVRVWETATGWCRSVLEGRPSPMRIAFSPDGNALQTDRGVVPLPSGLVAASALQPTKDLCYTTVERNWVSRQHRRFLWLPPEYRGCIAAVEKHMVCLGCNSGRISLLSLS